MNPNNLSGLYGPFSATRIFRVVCALFLGVLFWPANSGSAHAQQMVPLPANPIPAPVQPISSLPAITAGFSINLNFINTPSAGELAAFNSAVSTWESIIEGYQIDDIFSNVLTIDVNLGPIDGFGGTLGSAGPTNVKLNATQTAATSTFIYTEKGEMNFDTADTPNLISNGSFNAVVLHEIGHVLGIGTLWSSSEVGLAGRQELYTNGSGQYTGAAGLAAYNSEFGLAGAFVPVELGGGAGTANAHWNEVDGGAGNTGIVSNIEPGPANDLRYELMTGWLNSSTYISSLTTQSLVDLGYVVVPEPSTFVLLAFGSVAVFFRRRQVH